MTSANERNDRIIAEFRENEGKVGGMFEGRPILLLTTKGAKSGRTLVTPLTYLGDGDRFFVFASAAGTPKNPAWYHNLVANPDTSIEVGADTVKVNATVIMGAERDATYARQVALFPQFGEYEAKTTRKIPMVALDRS